MKKGEISPSIKKTQCQFCGAEIYRSFYLIGSAPEKYTCIKCKTERKKELDKTRPKRDWKKYRATLKDKDANNRA